MGRTYRYDGESNSRYKKEKYLQERKKKLKRQIEESKPEKQEKRGSKDDGEY